MALVRHKPHRSILRISLSLSLSFFLSALLGFLRSRLLYSRFLKCCAVELDAYNAAFRLPDFLYNLVVSGALTASFIPIFSRYLHKNKSMAYRFASSLINVSLLAFAFVAVLFFVFSRQLSAFIAPGFNQEQLNTMSQLTKILIFPQGFLLISSFLTGMIQSNGYFFIPSIAPSIYNVVIIFGILFISPIFGIKGVAYSIIIGAFFHLLVQIPTVFSLGFRHKLGFNLQSKGLKKVFSLMIPRSMSIGLSEIQNTLTQQITSVLPTGSLSILSLTFQLIYLPSRIFGSTIGQASLPILSRLVAKKQFTELKKTIRNTFLETLFIIMPIFSLFTILRLPIVRIVFGTKHFPWTATVQTSNLIKYMAVSIIFQSCSQILVRAFHALRDTKTPLKISFFSLAANLICAIIVVFIFKGGIIGVALAYTFSNFISFILLVYFLNKKVNFDLKIVWLSGKKIVTSGLLSGLVTWQTMKFLDNYFLNTSKTIELGILLLITSMIGAISYILLCRVLDVDESSKAIRFLSRFFRK